MKNICQIKYFKIQFNLYTNQSKINNSKWKLKHKKIKKVNNIFKNWINKKRKNKKKKKKKQHMSIKDELSKNKIKKNNQKNNDLQIIINIDLLIVKKFKNLFSNEYHIM